MTVKDCASCRSTINADLFKAMNGIKCSECGFAIPPVATSHQRDVSTKRMGRFEMVEVIGQGSFGEVWKAFDPHLDRHVAIKMPRCESLDPVEAELFLREARTAAQVQHSNVVGIHEVNRDGDQIYLVCDLIEGESLSARCSRRQHKVLEVVSIVWTMASALHHVHDCGVIHRDLKPSNILMDTTAKPFLSDFGLARRIKGDVTLTIDGQLVGTPAYMSPEQARGDSKKIDERSDIYSLGVVLYELLTNKLPFDGTPHTILGKVVNEVPKSPRKRNPEVHRDLETICMKCLEKDPGKRYPNAAELAVDLGRFSRGESIVSRPIGTLEKMVRWSRRNMWQAACVLSLAGIICFGVLVIRANEAAAIAEREKKRSDNNAAHQKQKNEIVENAVDNFLKQGKKQGRTDIVREVTDNLSSIRD